VLPRIVTCGVELVTVNPRWRNPWSSTYCTRFLWQQSRTFWWLGRKFALLPSRVPYPKRRSIASVEGGPRIGPNLVTLVLEPEASCRLPSGNFSQQPMDGSSFPGPHVQSPAVSLSSEANDLGLQAGALRKALLSCIASCQSTSLFLLTPRL
jgi:hypothetical protein